MSAPDRCLAQLSWRRVAVGIVFTVTEAAEDMPVRLLWQGLLSWDMGIFTQRTITQGEPGLYSSVPMPSSCARFARLLSWRPSYGPICTGPEIISIGTHEESKLHCKRFFLQCIPKKDLAEPQF